MSVGDVAAWASFSGSAGASTSITTNSITAPTGVTATLATCSNARWIDVTISWRPSRSARISGYAVTAYWDGGAGVPVGTTGTGSTSLTTTLDKQDGTSAAFTGHHHPTYGWSAESLRVTAGC
ncbi:MAG TPA: hypothetical protein VGN47_05085 [Blastococcus sp.]|nr:hypothetical protein [Blastococcus sp.]